MIEDGKPIGKTPLVVKVERSRPSQIVLHKAGFVDARRELKGDQPKLEVTLAAVAVPMVTPPPPAPIVTPVVEEQHAARPKHAPAVHRKLPTLPRLPPQ